MLAGVCKVFQVEKGLRKGRPGLQVRRILLPLLVFLFYPSSCLTVNSCKREVSYFQGLAPC